MSDAYDVNLATFESALKTLQPTPARWSRDELMFRAGRRSARRHAWVWPTVSTALATLLALQSSILIDRAEPQARPSRMPRVVSLPAPDNRFEGFTHEPMRSDPAAALLHLENQVARWGPDALPRAPDLPDMKSTALSLSELLGSAE